jgi:hypothetical protein
MTGPCVGQCRVYSGQGQEILCCSKGPQHVRSNAAVVQCLSATKRPGETLTTYIKNVWSCNSTHPHASLSVGYTFILLKQRKCGKTRPENARRKYEQN